MGWWRRLGSTYARIGKVYWGWAPVLLLVALLVFLPLGLLDAVSVHADAENFNLDSGFKVAALMGAIGAIAATSLLGEVFYSGVIAALLTHDGDGEHPTLPHIARHLDYVRLIVVDLVFVAIVIAGLLLAIVPGVLAFIWLGLAGPVVEIERRGVIESLRRSASLVRRNFLFVTAVVVPLQLVGDAAGEALEHLVHGLLGDNFFATWMADSGSEIVLTPLLGVATVILTIDLIAAKDGSGPRLNSGRRGADELVTA